MHRTAGTPEIRGFIRVHKADGSVVEREIDLAEATFGQPLPTKRGRIRRLANALTRKEN